MIALGGYPDSRAKSLSMERTNVEQFVRIAVGWLSESLWGGWDMPKSAFDTASLIRVGTYIAELERLHLWGTDEDIDREFNAVCQTIWGFTLDDFDDDCVVKADHDWLDELTPRMAYRFAAENGYDLGDYANGEMVSDWWGFAWMILAEKRGLLTPEQRALAWKKHDDRLFARENVVGAIRNVGNR
jgi:hypothetical protein